MIDYRSMAANSVLNRSDLAGWRDDLTDTNQFSMADILIRLMEGLPVEDAKLFMLAWYLQHCDSQRP